MVSPLKQVFRAFCTVALLSSSASVFAEDESNWYYGISAIQLDVDASDPANGIDVDVVSGGHLAVGYELAKHLSFEGRYEVANDSDFKLNSAYALFKLNLPLNENAIAYLALGGTSAEFKFPNATAPFDMRVREEGGALGIGVNLFGNEKTAINLEILGQDVSDDDGVDSDLTRYSIGFVHYFGGHK